MDRSGAPRFMMIDVATMRTENIIDSGLKIDKESRKTVLIKIFFDKRVGISKRERNKVMEK